MGHAMRSAVLLERLTASGHDMRIVVSGRAADYLEKRHPGRVTKITGLTMSTRTTLSKRSKRRSRI